MKGYNFIPVFTYIEGSLKDDLIFTGCKYVQECDGYYYSRNDTFTDVAAYIMPALRDPIKNAYKLTDDQAWKLSFTDLYGYSDSELAEAEEGLPRKVNYTLE